MDAREWVKSCLILKILWRRFDADTVTRWLKSCSSISLLTGWSNEGIFFMRRQPNILYNRHDESIGFLCPVEACFGTRGTANTRLTFRGTRSNRGNWLPQGL